MDESLRAWRSETEDNVTEPQSMTPHIGISKRIMDCLCCGTAMIVLLATPQIGLGDSPAQFEADEPGYRQTLVPFFNQHLVRYSGT